MTTPPTSPTSRVMRELSNLARRQRLATAREISEAVGIPLQAIYKMTNDGRIPVIRFGRMCRYDPAQIGDLLNSGGTPRGEGS